MAKILQLEPWIDESELDALRKVIESTFLVEHEFSRQFESQFEELTGAARAVATCNGTAALFCSLKATGVGHGDEVIVPDFTYIATATAVILAGAKPVFCEVEGNYLSLDLEHAERLINSKTKAMIPVHLYGQAGNVDRVVSFAKEHGLAVIEDAAQSVGVTFKGRHVGTFGDLGAFSFYGNKTITCGEGGMVVTNDPELGSKCVRLKMHGRDQKGTYLHEEIGFNFCITDMQSAVAIAQMKKLDAIVEKKRAIFDNYRMAWQGIEEMEPMAVDADCEPVHWLSVFFTDRKEELKEYLLKQDIQVRDLFCPLHRQPCFRDLGIQDDYPVSDRLFRRGLALPSSYSLTTEEQQVVVDAVEAFFKAS